MDSQNESQDKIIKNENTVEVKQFPTSQLNYILKLGLSILVLRQTLEFTYPIKLFLYNS